MFAKDKVSQSLIDAVNKVLTTESKKPEQLNEAFPTVADAQKRASEPKPSGGAGIKLGTRYGGGRQADEPEKDDDEPKARAKYGARKTRFTNTKLYKEDDDCVDEPKAKEIAKKEVGKHEKSMHKEELKGNQHKIDANKNGKIDAHDFELLRSKKKKMTEGMTFADRLVESMYGKKSALPIDEKEMSDAQKKKREEIVMSMKKDTEGLKKRYGSRWKDVMYATATKQAMKQETYGEEVELDEAKAKYDKDKVVAGVQAAMRKSYDNQMQGRAALAAAKAGAAPKKDQDEKDRVVTGLRAAMRKSYDNEMKGRAALAAAKAKAKRLAAEDKSGMKEEFDKFEEEIDPDVRTKDALSGANKPTKQKDDVGPGSDSRSTKVKFKGGPTNEEKEDEGHEDEKDDKALVKKMVKKDALKEEEQLDELSKETLRSYVDKAKKENLPGKGGNRGVALLTPGTRDKGVHSAVDRMKKMKANEEVESTNEGAQQLLRKYVPGYAKSQIDKKMDAGKFGKDDVAKDANFYRYKKIQDKLKKEETELDETSHMDKPRKLKSFLTMKKEMLGKAGMTSEKKDEE